MRWLFLVMLAGCGSVQNYPCNTEGEARCEGADIAYCEKVSTGGLKWQVFRCGGGCDSLRKPLCTWAGAMDGERCPLTIAGTGQGNYCSADGRMMFCLKGAETAEWHDEACPLCMQGKRPEDVLRPDGAGHLNCQ